MNRVRSWLRRLGWKWRILIAVVVIMVATFLMIPEDIKDIQHSRYRKPSTYTNSPTITETTFLVTYDSGDGIIEQTDRTLKVIETGVVINSETCFHAVTLYDPYPKRKVNAPIVHSTVVTLGEDEIWRSENDMRMVSEKVMQTNLPIVNTAVTHVSFSQYLNYPGWPYHVNDVWTYEASYDPDAPFMSGWTNTFRAEVIADDAVIEIGAIKYPCFKVIHTLIDTNNRTPSGAGVGSTIIEYWYKNDKSISPIRIEDSIGYQGTEIQTMNGTAPPSLP